DAGADLEPLEELSDGIAGQRLAVAVGEEGCRAFVGADAMVQDVTVEGLERLDRDRHIARTNGLARGRSNVQPAFAGVDVLEAKADELFAAEAAPEHRPDKRRVAVCELAF